MALEDIRREYRAALADLTFNSRPIIHNLTVIAQENLASGAAIVQAIEDQLRNVVPKQKLPILYLLDSICKNVGLSYKELFSRNLLGSFCAAFEAVDPEDKERFIKVLDTWRRHPGGPVFPNHLLSNIERQVQNMRRRFDARPVSGHPPQQQRPIGGPPLRGRMPPQNGHARPQYHQQAPPDRWAPHDRRQPARDQGRYYDMYQDHPQEPQMPRYNPPPAIPQAKVPDAQTLAKLQLTQQIQTLLLQAQERRLLNPLDLVNTNQISILSKLSEIVLTTELDIATQLAIAQQLKEIGNAVIKPVINAEPIGLGGLSQATSDLLAGVAMPSSSAIANSSNTLNSMSIRSVILQKIPKISLTNDDIARKQFGLAHIMLYEGLDMHCKQCGMRYFRTTDGNAKMQLHLDWHFRQNRRAKDKGRKAFSREWYQQEDEWVVERESDGKEAQAPTFFFDGKDPNETVPEVVEIPSLPVEGDKVPPCSVCNEDFEKYWDEDAEEWMIKNAVNVDGKLCHSTCVQDQSRFLLSSSESGLGKRKAEEENGAPPIKVQATDLLMGQK